MPTSALRCNRALLPLAVLSLALAAAPGHAHPITVDGNVADWPLLAPVTANVGRIARGPGGIGAFVWNDGFNDDALVAAETGGADLTSFRVTGTASHLSFLLRYGSPGSPFAGNGSPQYQIAIDLDRVAGSGQAGLAGNAETQVRNDARWEYLLRTRFGSSQSDVQTLNAGLVSQGSDPVAVNTTSRYVEFSVPWSRLGLDGPPATPVRLTIATFVSQASDDTYDVGGAGVSNLIDCVTNYGNPGTQPNTSPAESGDGVVDHAIDLHFSPSGEVVSPLLISEMFHLPSTSQPAGEWLEIVNAWGAPVSLDGCKLGDEETPDGPEGRAAFPPGTTLATGDVVVVCGEATTFMPLWDVTPDFELVDTEPSVPQMAGYTPWAAATPWLLNNFGDEVLLLDRWDTVLDALVYGGGVYAGVTAAASPDTDQNLARVPYTADRDSCSLDFVTFSPAGPGAAGNATVGVETDVPELRLAAPRPNPARGSATFALTLAEPARVRATVLDAAGRRVRDLGARELGAGPHAIVWDLRDARGTRVASGRYFLKLSASGRSVAGSIIVLD